MSRAVTLLRILLLCCLFVIGPRLVNVSTAQEAEPGCTNNPNLTMSQYVEILGTNTKNYLNPIFKQVPADLTIIHVRIKYVTLVRTAIYDLPFAESPTLAGLGDYSRFTALCRVKGPAEDWWLVTKTKDGYLGYTPEKSTEKARDYDARTKREREERQNEKN